MIKLLLDIKHRCPWIWDAIERLNGRLFRLRSRKPESVVSALPAKVPGGFRFLPVEAADIPELSRFLSSQPEERLQYFRPHHFDEKALRKRFDNPSFLMMKVRAETNGRLAGYFFLRFVIPLAKPIIAVIALYIAVAHWNNYYNALVYTQDTDLQPLQMYLRKLLFINIGVEASNDDAADVAEIKKLVQVVKYSVIVLSTMPIMCLYPFLQKYFVQGVMIGSIKG